jgi:hypothetical protein
MTSALRLSRNASEPPQPPANKTDLFIDNDGDLAFKRPDGSVGRLKGGGRVNLNGYALTLGADSTLAGNLTGGGTVYVPAGETVSLQSGAVLRHEYDANTILKADVDNTPIALSVPPSRLIGRSASGGIAALNASDARTVLGLGTMALEEESNYARLAGRSGGQTIVGGTNNAENLTLSSTSAATKGLIRFGALAYVNEAPSSSNRTAFAVVDNKDFFENVVIENQNGGASAAMAFVVRNNVGAIFECGILSSAHTAFPGYGVGSASFFRAGISSSQLNVITGNTSAPIRFIAGGNADNTPTLRLNPGSGGAGFFTDSPTFSSGSGLDVNAANLRLRTSRTISAPNEASQVGEINWQADAINVATSSGWKKAPLFWRFAPASVLYDLSTWTLGTNMGDDFLVDNIGSNGTGQWQWWPGAEAPSDAPYSYSRPSWLRVNSKYNADSSPSHAILYCPIAGGVNNYYWCRMISSLKRGQSSRVGFVVMNSTRTTGGAFWIFYNSSTSRMQLIAATYSDSTPWLSHANALTSNVAYTTGWTTRFTSQEFDPFAVSAPIVGVRTLSTSTDFVCTEATGVGLFRLALVSSFNFTASHIYLFVEGNLSERKAAFYDFVGVGIIPV